jgi:hypothetical protein
VTRGGRHPERYPELQRTVDTHCPVLDLLANAIPVVTGLVGTDPDGA